MACSCWYDTTGILRDYRHSCLRNPQMYTVYLQAGFGLINQPAVLISFTRWCFLVPPLPAKCAINLFHLTSTGMFLKACVKDFICRARLSLSLSLKVWGKKTIFVKYGLKCYFQYPKCVSSDVVGSDVIIIWAQSWVGSTPCNCQTIVRLFAFSQQWTFNVLNIYLLYFFTKQ